MKVLTDMVIDAYGKMADLIKPRGEVVDVQVMNSDYFAVTVKTYRGNMVQMMKPKKSGREITESSDGEKSIRYDPDNIKPYSVGDTFP